MIKSCQELSAYRPSTQISKPDKGIIPFPEFELTILRGG